jgi:hypothetical protein
MRLAKGWALVALTLYATRARGAIDARNHRLALMASDSELIRSVSIALTPWGVETLVLDVSPPGSSPSHAARLAADLARERDVDAVVWTSVSDRGSVLWVYDAASGDLRTRLFDGTSPLPSPVAASVALSLKTILRTTVVAPEAERFGATSEARPSRPPLVLEAGGELRAFAASSLEARFALGALAWIRPPPGAIGVAFEVAMGPGVKVATSEFSGRFRDLGLGPSVRWQFLSNRWWIAAASAGPTGHFTALDGALLPAEIPVSPTRFNVSLDAGARIDFRLSQGLRAGIGAKASYLPFYRRYLVNGSPILELWPLAAEAGVRVGVDLL